MTLCWSLDKLGPMARGVEDTLLVLAALTGPDPGDVSTCEQARVRRHAGSRPQGRLLPALDGRGPATEVDRAALEAVKKLAPCRSRSRSPTGRTARYRRSCSPRRRGVRGATLSHGIDQLNAGARRVANLFRQSRFLSASDMVQPTGCAARSRGDGAAVRVGDLCSSRRCATRC